MKSLIDEAENAGQLNVAFTAALLVGEKRRCVDLLLKSEKWSEAALFARSNVPEMTSQCVKAWRERLPNKKLAEALADPGEYPNLFGEVQARHD
jgi:coatomer subunit beta'